MLIKCTKTYKEKDVMATIFLSIKCDLLTSEIKISQSCDTFYPMRLCHLQGKTIANSGQFYRKVSDLDMIISMGHGRNKMWVMKFSLKIKLLSTLLKIEFM